MPGYPKHTLPSVRKQVQRCVAAARLQLERLREREKSAAAVATNLDFVAAPVAPAITAAAADTPVTDDVLRRAKV
jgi:hypothetical protein